MKLGITGSAGVLGSLLCRRLDQAGILYSRFEGDIRQPDDLARWTADNDWDGVIHLAAIVPTSQVRHDPLMAYDVNVAGTIHLMQALKETWHDRRGWFFYAGSSHVYQSSDTPIAEDYPLRPISLYGQMKLMAEQVVAAAGATESYPFDTCIGRIFSFYHPTQKPPFLYPNILRRLAQEDLSKPFLLPGADSVRDFLNAEQVVDIITRLALCRATGTVNIASGRPQRIRDFVQALSPAPLTIQAVGSPDFLVADIGKLNTILGE